MSKLYQFTTRQIIPSDLDTLWHFISSPFNLKNITPESMDFEITSDLDATTEMYPGQIISYKVSPLRGIRVDWVTEITHVVPKEYFVDEQRFGPYAFWHHKHFLRQVPGGVEMKDIVHYKLPFGPIGDLANTLLVKNKLKQIFDYRFKKMEQLFGRSLPETL